MHLYFPTYVAEGAGPGGEDVTVIEHGRLKALDDPEVRAVAARYGDPDELLREDWVPAVPGLNMAGGYNEHYARDPYRYTMWSWTCAGTTTRSSRRWCPAGGVAGMSRTGVAEGRDRRGTCPDAGMMGR